MVTNSAHQKAIHRIDSRPMSLSPPCCWSCSFLRVRQVDDESPARLSAEQRRKRIGQLGEPQRARAVAEMRTV